MRRNTLLLVAASLSLVAVTAPAASSAAYKKCKPVKKPYPGTRYKGLDLSRIRALRVSCRTARRVAKGAHYKALSLTPTGPIRRFTWKGWSVTGDLRPASDKYVAKKGRRRVRWRF